jgi:uncharacterized membrane protein
MRWMIILSALALTACGQDKNPSAPPPGPDLASNFSQPIDARGANPDWGLTIRGLELTLQRPGQPAVVGKAPGATIQPHQASWDATLANGQAMKVTVYASPCTDEATGVTHPFAAEVLLPDATPLNGCAGPAPKR